MRNWVQSVFTLGLLWGAGHIISQLISWPIPASIWGLALALVGLQRGWLQPRHFEPAAPFLLQHLPYLFVPAAAAALTFLSDPAVPFFLMLAISLVSTLLLLAVVPKLFDWARKESLQ